MARRVACIQYVRAANGCDTLDRLWHAQVCCRPALSQTLALRECMLQHADYYRPMLEEEEEAMREEEQRAAAEAEAARAGSGEGAASEALASPGAEPEKK